MAKTLALTATIRLPEGPVGRFSASGSTLWVSRDDKVREFILSSAGAIAPEREAPPPAVPAGPVLACGSWLLAAGDSRVRLFEISDSRVGTPRKTWKLGGEVADMIASENTVFGIVGDELRAWSLGDLPEAHELGGARADFGRRLTLDQGYAIVGADFNGVRIFDVRDPAAIVEVGSWTGPGSVGRVAVSGRHGFVADYSGGLSIVDLTEPRRPRLLSEWDEGIVGDVCVIGELAFLAMGDLVVLDVSNPRRPEVSGSFRVEGEPDTAWSVESVGGYVIALASRTLSAWKIF
jgi:hypothetical protein